MRPAQQVALDAMRSAWPEETVKAMLAAAEAVKELDRLEHCFDKATDLRFEDFARRAQARALVALRLISDIAPEANPHARRPQHVLDEWREHARGFGFET